jgi:hypothetical protein
MFPTKILLATDGSEEAGRAARMATVLSEKVGSDRRRAADTQPTEELGKARA